MSMICENGLEVQNLVLHKGDVDAWRLQSSRWKLEITILYLRHKMDEGFM